MDEASLLADITKDQQLTPGQAFERMKRLVKEYEEKKKVKALEAGAEDEGTAVKKRRNVKEYIDEVSCLVRFITCLTLFPMHNS